MNGARGGGVGMTAAPSVRAGTDAGPDQLRTLAAKFDREIGGVYGYVAAALRQQAADKEGGLR